MGIRAAKAGGMAALSLARLGDEALLAEVVNTLDEVALDRLAAGRLERKPASA